MRRDHLQYLACPACRSDLRLAAGQPDADGRIETGTRACGRCATRYAITAFIPRFAPGDTYAESFGLEWNAHRRTQYDSHTGVSISETRFFAETQWPRRLDGETILEVGSGSGRFTEQAARTGATVVSLEYSSAVEANYASNGTKPNVLVVQGDLFRMPVREGSFDKLFCFGVLQHTPDVERAFMVLPAFLRSGGALAVDVYRKPVGLKRLFTTKYWVRPLMRRMRPATLYALVRRYVSVLWPVARVINRIPRVGKKLNWALLIGDYGGVFPLSDSLLREWAILDTFDMLSPAYDSAESRNSAGLVSPRRSHALRRALRLQRDRRTGAQRMMRGRWVDTARVRAACTSPRMGEQVIGVGPGVSARNRSARRRPTRRVPVRQAT